VDFVQTGEVLEPIPRIGIVEQVLRHSGSIINATAMIAVTMLLIWFGLRPGLKAILEARPPEPVRVTELKADAAKRPDTALASQETAQPNLIVDLTSKLDRTPQRRLEQMIDFDEEQAATILKQWVRGAKSA
jgi:flagellar M-ring protein FliF